MDAVTTGIADATSLNTQASEHKVYTLDGRLCRIVRAQPGENPFKDLKAGIYITNGEWVGSLLSMQPGQGYMPFSGKTAYW